MIYIKRFVLMLQFLTRIPISVDLGAKPEDYGKGLVFAPIIGLILGGILALAYRGLQFVFPIPVCSVFIIILYIVLTGGLHLDGLGDTFDGLLSNRSRERILEIMRDSRIGTNGVLAVVCVLLVDVTVLASLTPDIAVSVLLLMPVAGRIGSLMGAGVSGYARSGEGLGKSFIDHCGVREILIGIAGYIAIFYGIISIMEGVWGIVPQKMLGVHFLSLFPVLTAFLSTKLLSRRIGGATGDILGAVCEINQTLFLIFAYVVLV